MNMLTRLNGSQQLNSSNNNNNNNNNHNQASSRIMGHKREGSSLYEQQEVDNSGKMISSQHQFHSLSPCQGDTDASSSLSNTDSDSLRSVPTNQNLNQNNNNNYKLQNQQVSMQQNSKSPILIKYNYYDYNGARQEQANHDMNYDHQSNNHNHNHNNNNLSNGARVQRNLSPTFKQSLDQIVRHQAGIKLAADLSSPVNQQHSPSSSPEEQYNGNGQQMMQFARRYKLSSYEQRCLRCNKTVYQMDKVGPLKDFTFYHQNCFKCRECGTKLTLKTYFNNQQSSGDQEVYCHRHCPKTGPGKLDNQSVGIRTALNAPKVFEVYHQSQLAANTTDLHHFNGSNNNDSNSNSPISPTSNNLQQQQNNKPQNPNVDSSALYIQHAVQQTRLQNIYKQSQVDKKISQFLNKRLEFLEPKQKMLEMRHREEEDALFKAFELKWRQEEKSISEQIKDEWQVELSKLLEKYKRQLNNISAGSSSSSSSSNHQQSQQQLLMLRQAKQQQQQQQQLVSAANEPKRIKQLLLKQLSADLNPNNLLDNHETANNNNNNNGLDNELSKQQMIEFERMNLEKTMTIKLDRKKETLKRKLKEFERQATAELVEKQSREMLALISMKLDEYKEEQKVSFVLNERIYLAGCFVSRFTITRPSKCKRV